MYISGAKIHVPEKGKKFNEFRPGDVGPFTGRKIINIIYQTSNYLVSIDTTLTLNWCADENMKFVADFGEVSSQVSLTDAMVDRIFVGRRNRMAYKKMLGEVLALLLDDKMSKNAKQALKEVKNRVIEHSKARVRMAYISYAVLSVIFIGLLVIAALVFKENLQNALHQTEIFRIMVCTLLGGIGAFITTFFRFQNYKGSIIAGLPIHRLDGFLRIFYGLIAGIFISLAIKGKVLAGFADNEQPWILYFLAMIAGASEVLIPNLIRQGEEQISVVKPKDSKTDTFENDADVPDNKINENDDAVETNQDVPTEKDTPIQVPEIDQESGKKD